jgi:hypothetical protein
MKEKAKREELQQRLRSHRLIFGLSALPFLEGNSRVVGESCLSRRGQKLTFAESVKGPRVGLAEWRFASCQMREKTPREGKEARS